MNDQLHAHLGKKLDEASYLLGFARSIIEGLTGGLPASDATIAEFKREYDAHFDAGRGAAKHSPRVGAEIGTIQTDSTQGRESGHV